MRSFLSFCLAIPLVLLLSSFVCQTVSQTRYFIYADNFWLMKATESILEDHDLDLKNQLDFDEPSVVDQIAEGKNGEWFPLHETLISFLAIPFFAVWGILGFLYFNLFVVIAISGILVVRTTRERHSVVSALVLVNLLLNSSVYYYIYDFSGDLLGSIFLAVAILCVVERRYLLAGLWAGISFLARNHLGPAVIALCLWPILRREVKDKWRSVKKLLIGIFPSVFVFSIYNYYLFGSPLSTSYDNWLVYQDASLRRFSQENLYSYIFVPNNIYLLVFDKVNGLLMTNWSQISLGVLGVVVFADRKDRNSEIFYLSSLCMVFVLALLSFRFLNFPLSGNRYLLFIPICCFPIMVEVIEYFRGLVLKRFSSDSLKEK